VIFAAANGARDIGLIGCDFSAGRAQAAQSSQGVPDARVFAGAAGAFEAMRCALERPGVHAVNHSWTI
jgi:hypothetical protein